jgi:hypothetical protein
VSQNLRACEERRRKKIEKKKKNYLIGPSMNGRRIELGMGAGNGEWRGDLEGWRGSSQGLIAVDSG